MANSPVLERRGLMTCNELFEKALDICGLRGTEADVPTDTDDLKQRALSLINVVLAENSVLDCRIKKTEHSVLTVSSMDDSPEMSDIVLNTVLPYGLARLLVMGEDDELSDRISRLYSDSQEAAIRFGKAKSHEITGVYE